MFGSRLLFRGYGTSRSMRPIDAALAYTDSLVFIDEAHLAVHLQGLLADLNKLHGAEVEALPEARRSPVVVGLTATGDPGIERFELDAEDYGHLTIRQRLDASKPVGIEVLDKATTPAQIASGVASVVRKLKQDSVDPGVVLVFVNRPVTARSVAQKLRSLRDSEVKVATGQIRGYEAHHVTRAIIEQAGSNVERGVRQKHLIVVATQTLEVGADIDADYLVTEACSVRALTQRLGRLNRLGMRPHAKAIYVHTPAPKKGSWPVYGDEPESVLARLRSRSDTDGIVNLSPDCIARVLGDPQDRPEPAPVVAPGILWEWIKTTTSPPGEAPVNPYFSGFDNLQRHVNVAWRAYLPETSRKLWPRLRGDETVEVPLSDAVEALKGLDDSTRWTLLDSRHRGTAVDSPEHLRPGNTILIRTDVGMLDQDGHWDPATHDPVLDVSILRSGLPIAPGVLKRLYGATLPNGVEKLVEDIVGDREGDDSESINTHCRQLCNALGEAYPSLIKNRPEWDHLVTDLRSSVEDRIRRGGEALVVPRDAVPRMPSTHGQPKRIVLSDEDDEPCVRSERDDLGLATHGRETADEASRILRSIGIVESLSGVVVRAARLHDIGKADSRFQRSLDHEWTEGSELRAKSRVRRSLWGTYRTRAGWPSGGRHEELSRRLVEAWLTQAEHDFDRQAGDLLQHLVVSHHGRGRPLVPPVRDTTAGSTLKHTIQGLRVSVRPDLDLIDWIQPIRFANLNRRYGPWGLALLEAIVRQSDHLVSSTLEVQ